MTDSSKPNQIQLWICATGIAAICVALLMLSSNFTPNYPTLKRPILVVLGLLGVSFLLYCWGCFIVGVWRRKYEMTSPLALLTILLAGLLFRGILIFSTPIQEIDLYRYIWDGATVSQNIDPYRVAPLQVAGQRYDPHGAPLPWKDVETNFNMSFPAANKDIQRLRSVLRADDGLAECFSHVHYGQFSSPYPPVSQWVFKFSESVTPTDASALTRMRVMKTVLVGFDLLTALGIIALLSMVGWPRTWVLVYWWCPLVLKEFANSGHLDSIVVGLTTWAIVAGVAAIRRGTSVSPAVSFGWSSLSAGLLATAVAAKVFPIVLFPIWFIGLLRAGWSRAIVASAVFFLLISVLMWPMLKNTQMGRAVAEKVGFVTAPDPPVAMTGIEAFSKYWEMNDLIFMTIVENVRPAPAEPDHPRPWFVLTGDEWRQGVVDSLSTSKSRGVSRTVEEKQKDSEIPFGLTRKITLAIFTVLAFGMANLFWFRNFVFVKGDKDPFETTASEFVAGWGEVMFLTIVWFWLLSPTQNPWYLIWSMPVLIFARSRIWLLLSGLVLMYYLRFYFEYFWAHQDVWGTGFKGVSFYYFYVPWAEFLPFYILLFGGWLLSRVRRPNLQA